MDTDVRRSSVDSSADEDESLCTLCNNLIKLFIVLSLLGGIVAILAIGIYFLVVDHNKGGPCARSVGQDIWTYFLVKLIVGLLTQCISCKGGAEASKGGGESALDSNGERKTETGDVGGGKVTLILGTLLLHVGMLAYGGIVLIHEEVCDSYTNTGLYKMAYALFFLDCSFLFIAVSLGLVQWLLRPAPQDQQSLNSKIEI